MKASLQKIYKNVLSLGSTELQKQFSRPVLDPYAKCTDNQKLDNFSSLLYKLRQKTF